MRPYSKKLFLFILVSIIMVLTQPASIHAQTSDTVFYVKPPLKQVEIGDEFVIEISVMDVVDLFAYELFITFPPDKLEVLAIEKGSFLEDWLIPVNEFDNDNGFIEFALSQGNPTLPKSGDGDLLIITFKAKPSLMLGIANIVILEDSILSDNNGTPIEYFIENGIVYHENPFQVFLPLILK